jgi:hypothetical protein
MQTVTRNEIIDFETYEDLRENFRSEVLSVKALRRIHVGEHFTLLFENPLTVRYQIQEMMRAERIVRETDIQHEIDTYNELLGGPGEIGGTLLIEVPDEQERDQRLREYLGLHEHIYARLDNGEKVYATFDARQIATDRLSSVQYLKFDTRGATPVAFGADHPAYTHEDELSAEQLDALRADLASDLN